MTGAMSVLVSNPQQVVLIAPPNSRRVAAFQSSLQRINWPQAKVISYQQIIENPQRLIQTVHEGNIIRLETSGESSDTERLLLQLGKQHITDGVVENIADLQLEQGEIIPSNQWYA